MWWWQCKDTVVGVWCQEKYEGILEWRFCGGVIFWWFRGDNGKKLWFSGFVVGMWWYYFTIGILKSLDVRANHPASGVSERFYQSRVVARIHQWWIPRGCSRRRCRVKSSHINTYRRPAAIDTWLIRYWQDPWMIQGSWSFIFKIFKKAATFVVVF